MEKKQVMLSYRITDSGAAHLGGDDTVPRIAEYLGRVGYSVFVGESSLEGGELWAVHPGRR